MVAIYRPTYFAGLRWLLKLDLQGWSRMIRGLHLRCLGIDEVKKHLAEGYSLIRWGDGETANLRGKTTWHQTGSPELAKLLNQMLRFLSSTERRILFGIPSIALEGLILKPSSTAWSQRKQLWSSRVLFNLREFRVLTEDKVFDSGVFYSQFSRIPEILNALNTDTRDVLYISSSPAPVLEEYCAHLSYVAIPKRDAFAEIENVKIKTLAWLSSSKSHPLILFSGGSAVKALCPELIEKSQVVDLGSGVRFLESNRVVLDWEAGRSNKS
jgi:hypothetical protein